MKTLIKIEDLGKTYQFPKGGVTRTVLKGLSLEVKKGQSLAILGPSGSGKSTLLNMIGALDIPDEGNVVFEGTAISGMNEADRDRFRSEKIGFVFQQHHLLPQHTVWENILIPTLATSVVSGLEQKSQTMEWGSSLLKACGIDHLRNQRPGQLSGGECLRTALVRALINRPSVLLADEPTGSLDSATADVITELLVTLNQELGITLIVVTHASSVAEKMNERWLLKNGSLLQQV